MKVFPSILKMFPRGEKKPFLKEEAAWPRGKAVGAE